MSLESPSSHIIQLTPKTLYRQLQYCIYSKRTPFVWGDPGIGKSAIIKYIADKLGFHFEDIRLSQIDSVDLRGLPVKSYLEYSEDIVDSKNPERGPVVEWAMPDFLSRAKEAKAKYGKPTLFFFDEFNSAMKNTLAAAYQLVLDHQIGCFTLDKDDVVIAAGNYETNGGITTPMPTPLANRFVHYNLKHSTEEWLDFANVARLHPYITAFIRKNPEKLHLFTDDTFNEDEKAFATPRSWHSLSDLAFNILNKKVSNNMFGNDEESNFKFDEEYTDEDVIFDLRTACAGCVGSSVAQEFIAFVKIGLDLPDPQDILSGKVKEINVKNDISREYLISNSCIFILKDLKNQMDPLRNSIQKSKEDGLNVDSSEQNKLEKIEDNYFKSIENFVMFAKNNFSGEAFIYAIVTNMMRNQDIQPNPRKVSKEAFKIIFEAYSRAKNTQ